jgi:hypothetical protein
MISPKFNISGQISCNSNGLLYILIRSVYQRSKMSKKQEDSIEIHILIYRIQRDYVYAVLVVGARGGAVG